MIRLMLALFVTLFSLFLLQNTTVGSYPDDQFSMPDFGPVHKENQAHIDALLEQIKKKIDDKEGKVYSLEYFSKVLTDFRQKHICALYQGFEGSGSYDHSYGSSGAALCMKQKQVKELEFLLNQEQDLVYVRFWLEDGETDFFESMKPLLFEDGFLGKIMELIKTKLSLKEIPEKHPQFYFGAGWNLSTSMTKFSKDEIIFLKALETAIHTEFLKILDSYKDRPTPMQAMLDGHSAWLSYRLALLGFYESVDVSSDMIKLRIICLNLARLYFYKRFLAYFVPPKGESERCLVMAPRDYSEMYDCDDIIRKPKGLPLTEPCCPGS